MQLIAVADPSGKLSDVTTVRLTTAQATDSSITLFEPGQVGTVTADVYVKYGVTGAAPTPVRYVVLPATEKAPSAAQISLGQNSTGTALTAPWTDTLTFAPGVKHTHTLTGLTANTAYKVYLVTGSGTEFSPVEIIQIHTK
jgi:hypothetical protein